MCSVPRLPRDLDFSPGYWAGAESVAPVLNNRQDQLGSRCRNGTQADRILTEVYKKASTPDRYRASFFEPEPPSKFDPGDAEGSGCLV
jgi:hypothetical protein